jgi:hypothetical protein
MPQNTFGNVPMATQASAAGQITAPFPVIGSNPVSQSSSGSVLTAAQLPTINVNLMTTAVGNVLTADGSHTIAQPVSTKNGTAAGMLMYAAIDGGDDTVILRVPKSSITVHSGSLPSVKPSYTDGANSTVGPSSERVNGSKSAKRSARGKKGTRKVDNTSSATAAPGFGNRKNATVTSLTQWLAGTNKTTVPAVSKNSTLIKPTDRTGTGNSSLPVTDAGTGISNPASTRDNTNGTKSSDLVPVGDLIKFLNTKTRPAANNDDGHAISSGSDSKSLSSSKPATTSDGDIALLTKWLAGQTA